MASQVKKLEDFTLCGEKLQGQTSGGLYRDSEGEMWLIKYAMGCGAIIEAYAANMCRLLAGDEHVPETCLVEGFQPGKEQKGYMLASKINSGFRGLHDLQVMSRDEHHPITLNNGKIVIHNQHPRGLLELIIASFIIADLDMNGNGEGNTGVDEDKLFRIDFGQGFYFDSDKYRMSRDAIHSLFLLLDTLVHPSLKLFTPNQEEIAKTLKKFLEKLNSFDWQEKLIALARQYEGYYAEVIMLKIEQLESEIDKNSKKFETAIRKTAQLELDISNRRVEIENMQSEIQSYSNYINSKEKSLIELQIKKVEFEIDKLSGIAVDPEIIDNLGKMIEEIEIDIQEKSDLKTELMQRSISEMLSVIEAEKKVHNERINKICSNSRVEQCMKAKKEIQAGLEKGDFFFATLKERINSFCHIIDTASQPPLSHTSSSLFRQGNQNTPETKEMQDMFKDFFQNYVDCVGVLLPNYVEAEIAACMASWPAQPEKIIEKWTKCIDLVEKGKKDIALLARSYNRLEQETGQYLTAKFTEKLARMTELRGQLLESKVVVNAAVDALEAPQLEMAAERLSFSG